jgi:uncharacterized protein (TIGR02391 family)
MKKTDNEIFVEKLNEFEKRCDNFLEILQNIEILNLNFEQPPEAVIDVQSAEWKMFCHDLRELIKKYSGNLGKDFESMVHKVTAFPNTQNISDLKVSIYSLKNHFIDTMGENISAMDIWRFIHAQISAVSKQRFEDGYYADAVECAFKEINTRVKKLYLKQTGEEKDGSDLMRKAFSPNKPVLIFECLDTQTGKSVQQGYMDIFAGAMTGIRNPKAHANMTITEVDAVQRLMFASLLMSKIDEAVSFTGISE